MSDILQRLAAVIEERGAAPSGTSYVASLRAGGLERILAKIGEEATETILAARGCAADESERLAVVRETADLWFHSMIMLAHLGLGPDKVLAELERRFGTSGLAERAARQTDSPAGGRAKET